MVAIVVIAILVGGFSLIGLVAAIALGACGVVVPWWSAAILIFIAVGVLQAGRVNTQGER